MKKRRKGPTPKRKLIRFQIGKATYACRGKLWHWKFKGEPKPHNHQPPSAHESPCGTEFECPCGALLLCTHGVSPQDRGWRTIEQAPIV